MTPADRCRLEIAAILATPESTQEKAFACVLGLEDWRAELELVEREEACR